MLYAMESAWNSPARTRGTKRMSVMPALVQTEDGGYAELETEGDQALEGGGAQTVQGDGEARTGRSDDDGSKGVTGGQRSRGRIRHR
ncbi:MAG TPA: hypothetical protein VNT56_06355 [Acidimicrobiales bacterium]|nr:hypothetical protein [Acidimicrobiales bacterium]